MPTFISTGGGSGVDNNAIHVNESGEIAGLTRKVTPVASDVLVMEDSGDGFSKKYLLYSDVGGGQWEVAGGVLANSVTSVNEISFEIAGAEEMDLTTGLLDLKDVALQVGDGTDKDITFLTVSRASGNGTIGWDETNDAFSINQPLISTSYLSGLGFTTTIADNANVIGLTIVNNDATNDTAYLSLTGNSTGALITATNLTMGQDGSLILGSIASGSAPNNSLFRDSGNSNLISFKDSVGTVHDLTTGGGGGSESLIIYPFDGANATGHDWNGVGDHNVSIEYEWDRDNDDVFVRAEVNANNNWDEAVWKFHLPENFDEFDHDEGDPFEITIYTTNRQETDMFIEILIDGKVIVESLGINPSVNSTWQTVSFMEGEGGEIGSSTTTTELDEPIDSDFAGAEVIVIIRFTGEDTGAGEEMRVKDLKMKYKTA